MTRQPLSITLTSDQLTQIACNMGVPRHMATILASYIKDHTPPSSDFLVAVLMNNLKLSVKKADHLNVQCLPAYVEFLIAYSPMGSWGSEDYYHDWVASYWASQSKLIAGLVAWTQYDQSRARAEGWECVPTVGVPSGTYLARITRYAPIVKEGTPVLLDVSLNFADDEAAHKFVLTRAMQGSLLHARALLAVGDDLKKYEKTAL